MYRGVGEAQYGGHAHRDDQTEEDADYAGQGEVEPELQHVDPPQHEDGVEEHGTVAYQHQVGVEEDRLRTRSMLFSSFHGKMKIFLCINVLRLAL